MDWWLIILTVVIVFVVIGTVAYMMVVFSSPEDKNAAYFPKIIIVMSLSLALFTVLLLPLDVANVQPMNVFASVPGGLHLDLVWQILLMANLVLVLVVIPFSICYYESYDPEEEGIARQLRVGLCWTITIVVIFLGVFFLGWYLGGKTHIPYTAYSVYGVDRSSGAPNSGGILGPATNTVDKGLHLVVRCSPIVYAIALLSFLGWFFFVIFGGVGIAALPMDLILGFIHRPMPISTNEYASLKVEFQDLSGQLMERGDKLMQKHKAGKSGAKFRRALNEFNFECKELERKYKKLELAYKEGGESPFISFGKLLLGFLGIGISLAWVLHIILNNATHVSPFLNSFFTKLDSAWGLLGTIAYAVFTLYLLWATVAGVVKVSNRFMFFEIHPLRPHDTLTNSFLFNCLILEFTAITITQFASSSFSQYANATACATMFVTYIENLQGLGVVFKFIQYALLGTIGLGLLFCLLCPYKKRSDDD